MSATVSASVSTGNIKPTQSRVEHILVRDVLQKEINIAANETAEGNIL